MHRAVVASEEVRARDLLSRLDVLLEHGDRLLRAADDWLRDPEIPERYSLAPREHEVTVIWEETLEGRNGARVVRHKELLSGILARCAEKGGPRVGDVRCVEVLHADPRKLLLDAVDTLRPLLELLGKATGQLRPEGGLTTVIFASPEWGRIEDTMCEVLRTHPGALEAVGKALEGLRG